MVTRSSSEYLPIHAITVPLLDQERREYARRVKSITAQEFYWYWNLVEKMMGRWTEKGRGPNGWACTDDGEQLEFYTRPLGTLMSLLVTSGRTLTRLALFGRQVATQTVQPPLSPLSRGQLITVDAAYRCCLDKKSGIDVRCRCHWNSSFSFLLFFFLKKLKSIIRTIHPVLKSKGRIVTALRSVQRPCSVSSRAITFCDLRTQRQVHDELEQSTRTLPERAIVYHLWKMRNYGHIRRKWLRVKS